MPRPPEERGLSHLGYAYIKDILMPKAKQQSLKPLQQKLHCPFCEATSTRGTGLSAHVRARHPKQYKNWNRNLDRFVEAANVAAPPKAEPKRGSERESDVRAIFRLLS